MTCSKIILLLISAFLFISTIVSCSEDGIVKSDTDENKIEIDSQLIGEWNGLGTLPRTLTFEMINETEGRGILITDDYHGNCDNMIEGYLSRIDFKWTQTSPEKDGWSAFYYNERKHLGCGGTRNYSLLAFEQFYSIQGDTLYLGTADYQIYVRMK